RRASRCVAVHNEVVKIEIAETARMRPARGRVVKTYHVCIRVVEIGEGAQVIAAEAGDAEVVVVAEAIERLEILRDVVIGASAAQSFVEGDAEVAVEFRVREGRNGRGLLAILVIMLVFDVPEPFVFNEVSARVPASLLPVEWRLGGVR